MIKRWMGLILCWTLALSSSPFYVSAAFDDSIIITTAEELAALSEEIAADPLGGAGQSYRLASDIDLGGAVWEHPIGTLDRPFCGSFDGGGRVIKNYRLITTPSEDGNHTYTALFGVLSGAAEVKNLGIENVTVDSKIGGYQENAGAIAGCLTGNARIEKCYVRGFTVAYRKENSDIGAEINAVGAIAGVVNGDGVQVKDCYSVGVTIPEGNVDRDAGIVGIGTCFLGIENCYSDYTVVRAPHDRGDKVKNSYYLTTPPWPGTDLGNEECYFGMQTDADTLKETFYVLGGAYQAGGAATDGLPALSWETVLPFPGEVGTKENPYLIETAEELANLAKESETEGKYYRLASDIDLGGAVWEHPIGVVDRPFCGSFDGGGRVIKNYRLITTPSEDGNHTYTGIFGVLSGAAEVKNLGIENVTVDSKFGGYQENAGAIAGCLTGNARIEKCYVRGFTVAYRKENSDIGAEINAVGAIAGVVNGDGVQVKDCYSVGVTIPEGNVDRDAGIVGIGTCFLGIENCYSDYTVVRAPHDRGDKVKNSYYLTTPPWPGTNPGNEECYFGTKVDADTLRESAELLGSAYKTGSSVNQNFPMLVWEDAAEISFSGGNGSAYQPYLIGSAAELKLLAGMKDTDGMYYRLTCDLDLGGADLSYAIGTLQNPFQGDFDGSGYEIRNYKIAANDGGAHGLFANVGGNALIHHLGINEVTVTLLDNIGETAAVGALIGSMQDNAGLYHCYGKNVTIDAASVTESGCKAGVLVGLANGDGAEIVSCYSQEISSTEGDASKLLYFGEIVGYGKNLSRISRCYAPHQIGKTDPYVMLDRCYQGEKDVLGRPGITQSAPNQIPAGFSYDYTAAEDAQNTPKLKWEEDRGFYRNLIPSGTMSFDSDRAFELFGAAGAKTVLGSEIGEDSMSLFLPGGTVLSCGVSTQKDAYYRISFRDRLCAADDQASALTLLFGDENLSGALSEIVFSGAHFVPGAVYVKANKTGRTMLTLGLDKDWYLDDLSVMRIDPEKEVEEIERALSQMETDTKYETYLKKSVCDGVPVTYRSENNYFDREGRKIEKNIPIGGETQDKVFAAVKVADLLAEKTINVTVAVQEAYEIITPYLTDKDGNAVYSLSAAEKVKEVRIIRHTDTPVTLYAAQYQNDVLTKIKTVKAEQEVCSLNWDIRGANRLKFFLLEDSGLVPASVPKEPFADHTGDGAITVYPVGGSVSAADSDGGFGWGSALSDCFDKGHVRICTDFSGDRLTPERFVKEEAYLPAMQSALNENDVVLLQLSEEESYPDAAEMAAFYTNIICRSIAQQGAIPVLVTPAESLTAARNQKTADGTYATNPHHVQTAAVIRTYANDRNIPLLDLNGYLIKEMQQQGAAVMESRRLWNNQEGDYHHFSARGAKWAAAWICDAIRGLSLPAAKYLTSENTAKPVDVFSIFNADFHVKSSTGMEPMLDTSITRRDGKVVFDRDIITTAGTEEYDGIPIYDINGNPGSDYIVLMDIDTTVPVPLEKLKVFWETGTPYQDGPLMYKDKPTRAWAEGFEIYVSDTAEDGTWERVYAADSLEGKVQTEVVSATLWDDSGGVRPYYEFVLDRLVTTKHVRMAIRDMQPWLGDIQIHEIYGYADQSAIPKDYHRVTVKQDQKVTTVIRSDTKIGENYCPAGKLVTLDVSTDATQKVQSVTVNGTAVSGYQRYNFTMPNEDVLVEIKTESSDAEKTPLTLTDISVTGGSVIAGGTVPVITMNFSRAIDTIDKGMILVNGQADSGLVQHAFRDATDPKKAYIVLFADKLTSDTSYTVTADGIQSAGGAMLSGTAQITFRTASDYQSAMENRPKIPWTEDISPIESLDVNNKKNHTWTQVPAVTQELRDMGVSGGEGGQWMQAIEIDKEDGNLMFAGIDIAGLIRSTDGGKSWHRSYCGFTASGCVDIEIDPNNKNRVLAIGSLSNEPFCGIYMSEDMGYSWHHVYSYVFNGQRDTRGQLAWDKSSYDKKLGGSKVAYWSNLYRLKAGLENSDQEYQPLRSHSKGGLIKTVDGGKNWFIVNKEMSDSVIAVHPTKGIVYAGNESGFFRSEDGGVTFTQILSDEPIYGLDVIGTRPDYVYINDSKGVLISKDCGKTFTRVKASGFPKRTDLSDVRDIVRDLAVSPANPNYMMVDDRNYHRYNNKRYYSHDGGKTWAESSYDTSKDFFFNHSRQHPYAWHPTDENKVWTLGGDWIVSSNDGGKSFIWDNNGNCGTPPGGRFNFNPFNTDLIFCGAQDLTGLLSTNRGNTFVPIESEGGFGCTYGNYAADENLLIAAIADGWYTTRKLHVSRDGGKSFENTGLALKYGYARRATSFWGSPTDLNTLFAGEYVTHDRAKTWKEMNGCQFVMAVNYYHNREIYGLNNEVIVVSYDNGETWYPFSETHLDDEEASRGWGKHCWDIEYDGINDILYYANGSGNSAHNLVRVENNVHKNIGVNVQLQERVGDKWYQLIALDPRHPDILYVGGYGSGQMKCSNSVQRSCDRGESFQIISSMGDNKSIVKDGDSAGSGCETLVVHPEDGTLWMWASGEGLWTFPAPYE